MEGISLGTKISFKTMLKILRNRNVITTQDGSVNSVMTNDQVAIFSRAEQCFYEILLWIKTMLSQV